MVQSALMMLLAKLIGPLALNSLLAGSIRAAANAGATAEKPSNTASTRTANRTECMVDVLPDIYCYFMGQLHYLSEDHHANLGVSLPVMRTLQGGHAIQLFYSIAVTSTVTLQ